MKRFLTIMTSVILCIALLPAAGAKADDEGVWQLVECYYETHEADPQSGEYYTEYFMESKYDEKEMEAFHTKTVHVHNIDGDFSTVFNGHCVALTPTVKAGDLMDFYVETEVSGNTLDGLISNFNGTMVEKGYLIYFTDVQDYDHRYISAKTGPDYVQKDSAVVARKMSAGKELGEQYVVDLQFSSGSTSFGYVNFYFVYEWTKPVTIAAPAKATLKSVSLGTNKATVKWKKITKNCKGYEIEVATKKDFSDAKVYTISKNKTVKKAISGLKEDVIYYIRVRAFNSKSGQKAYGGYSKTKKIVL